MRILLIVAALVTVIPAQAEPREFDPYAGPKPVVVWIQADPWAMVIGADTPTLALYEDGTRICIGKDEAGVRGYLRRKLSPDELKQELQAIQALGSFSGLKPLYELSRMTDLPSARFFLDLGGGPPVATEVYGLTRETAVRGEVAGGRRPRDPIPESVTALHQHLARAACTGEAWLPEHVEVMLWPYAYAPDKSIKWPSGWPGLDSPDARRRGDSYSIYLPGSSLKELQAFLRTRSETGAVEVGGRKWAASYRYAFPSEPVWFEAFRRQQEPPAR